jgi:hypothetical protein
VERNYTQGYRLRNDGDGLSIEATEYHARPLFLDSRTLAEIGLQLREDHELPSPATQAADARPIIVSLLRTLDRVAGLVEAQKQRARWKRHRENLHKLMVLLGGLDEGSVAWILDQQS